MTPSMLVLVFGAFLVGGVISLAQQKKPLWVVVALAVLALAFIVYGAYSWMLAAR